MQLFLYNTKDTTFINLTEYKDLVDFAGGGGLMCKPKQLEGHDISNILFLSLARDKFLNCFPDKQGGLIFLSKDIYLLTQSVFL